MIDEFNKLKSEIQHLCRVLSDRSDDKTATGVNTFLKERISPILDKIEDAMNAEVAVEGDASFEDYIRMLPSHTSSDPFENGKKVPTVIQRGKPENRFNLDINW